MTIDHPRDWLDEHGFRPVLTTGVSREAMMLDQDIDMKALGIRLIHTPAKRDTYLPIIAAHASATELFKLSAMAFIAEIWTHLLVTKKDKNEKPIYLLWDDEIPIPNESTILFWLMICESWPMPRVDPVRARRSDSTTELHDLFPAQSFVLPASSHKLHSTQYPPEFVNAPASLPNTPLDLLLEAHMTRADREKMTSASYATRVHRPQGVPITHYWAMTTLDKRNRWPGLWIDEEGWPHVPVARLDSGVAKDELLSSWWHLRCLQLCRQGVMKDLLTSIGMPTSYGALFTCPGGWIRQWSESCVMINGSPSECLLWSTEHDSVTMASGMTFSNVPLIAPKIWLGWTHVGPKYDVLEGQAVREESASERWARAYMLHRPLALRMLFRPQSIPNAMLNHIHDEHLMRRTRQLKHAGRLTKATQGSKLQSFADAFRQVMADKEPKS
jgi:hypothetical protein